MKTKVLGLITMFLMTTAVVFAQEKTEKFKVYGNCGMCEKRVEKAASAMEGVAAADWDKESKMIEIKFNTSKTNADAVKKAIVKVGHDTEEYKAKDSVYNDLPGCCKYDRPEGKKKHDEGHMDHSHKGHSH